MNITINGHDHSEDDSEDMVVLGEEYEEAFLGHDVSVEHLPRAVYSLPLLLLADSLLHDGGEARSHQRVAEMVQQTTALFGDRSPIFLDDTYSRERREKPRIYRP